MNILRVPLRRRPRRALRTPAREFAELIGEAGHTLVWGGSDTGLMKVVADGVRETGGRLRRGLGGVSPGLGKKDADEMVIARDLAERKALLLAKSDAVVVMAGGLGTLDEATDILEQRKHGLHDKPVVLLNTAGFYDGLALQLRRMEEEGFLPVPACRLGLRHRRQRPRARLPRGVPGSMSLAASTHRNTGAGRTVLRNDDGNRRAFWCLDICDR